VEGTRRADDGIVAASFLFPMNLPLHRPTIRTGQLRPERGGGPCRLHRLGPKKVEFRFVADPRSTTCCASTGAGPRSPSSPIVSSARCGGSRADHRCGNNPRILSFPFIPSCPPSWNNSGRLADFSEKFIAANPAAGSNITTTRGQGSAEGVIVRSLMPPSHGASTATLRRLLLPSSVRGVQNQEGLLLLPEPGRGRGPGRRRRAVHAVGEETDLRKNSYLAERLCRSTQAALAHRDGTPASTSSFRVKSRGSRPGAGSPCSQSDNLSRCCAGPECPFC